MTMRPVYLSFTPTTASTTFWKTGATGAGPFTTFSQSSTGDSLAHKVDLTSTANLSGINMTIAGTDADGQSISEVIAGPNINTVTSTKFFKTITSVTAASTLGANTMDIGLGAGAVSKTIPLEQYLQGSLVHAQVVITGTINVDIEDTLSDLHATPNSPSTQDSFTWANDANFTAKTASLQASLAVLARAARLAVNSYNAGATVALGLITPK